MSNRRALVIDDDEAIRAVLEYNLQEIDVAVTLASDAASGWELFQREAPDIVITDVRMAGMSGMDLLGKIRAADPGAVVIVITAYGTVEQAVEAMKRGAHDYLTKPFHREALKLSVQKALELAAVRQENQRLRRELHQGFDLSRLIGTSPAMRALFSLIERVAPTDATVLIQGETGTGKELIAHALHHSSSRSAKNFVVVNCAAIPGELLESELFGHRRGAFTGAISSRTGKFELADGGTIFLDEVGDIDLELQKKLLRVLQEREIDVVGASAPRTVDVRVIAATNQDLARLVESGRFRKDLYYRLNVVPIIPPPLRERKEDLPLLVEHFLEKLGGSRVRVSPEALAALQAHDWPGNVRELENVVERALILRAKDNEIGVEDGVIGQLRSGSAPSISTPGAAARVDPRHAPLGLPEGGVVLDDVEKRLIIEALEKTEGNQSAAARLLGITRQTLIYRMQKHALRGPGA